MKYHLKAMQAKMKKRQPVGKVHPHEQIRIEDNRRLWKQLHHNFLHEGCSMLNQIRRQATGASEIHAIAKLVVILRLAREPGLQTLARLAFTAGKHEWVVCEA